MTTFLPISSSPPARRLFPGWDHHGQPHLELDEHFRVDTRRPGPSPPTGGSSESPPAIGCSSWPLGLEVAPESAGMGAPFAPRRAEACKGEATSHFCLARQSRQIRPSQPATHRGAGGRLIERSHLPQRENGFCCFFFLAHQGPRPPRLVTGLIAAEISAGECGDGGAAPGVNAGSTAAVQGLLPQGLPPDTAEGSRSTWGWNDSGGIRPVIRQQARGGVRAIGCSRLIQKQAPERAYREGLPGIRPGAGPADAGRLADQKVVRENPWSSCTTPLECVGTARACASSRRMGTDALQGDGPRPLPPGAATSGIGFRNR